MNPTRRSLAYTFLGAVGSERESSAQPDVLEGRLEHILAEGRQAWPELTVDPMAFVRHVAEHLPRDGVLEDNLTKLHAADLYLAYACATGDGPALAAFDRVFVSQVAAYLARTAATPALCDEVRQVLRARVLVASVDTAPRIANYSGRGPLGGWVRMTAARIAVDLRRSQRADLSADEASPLRGSTPDPELSYLKSRYGHEFQQAFRATLGALPAKEASILRLHYLEAMPAEAIGALYRVHARTVQKWIARSRQNILEETHRLLCERLGLHESEVNSMVALVKSQLDASIFRILRSPE